MKVQNCRHPVYQPEVVLGIDKVIFTDLSPKIVVGVTLPVLIVLPVLRQNFENRPCAKLVRRAVPTGPRNFVQNFCGGIHPSAEIVRIFCGVHLHNSRRILSGISKPVVWGTRGLHPGFPWFSSFSLFP